MMNSSIQSTIEKIKLQEQGKEAQLREQRTIESTLASLSRNVREAMSRTAKLKQEIIEGTARADALAAVLSLEQAQHSCLTAQLEASIKQVQQLKTESDQGILKVWKLRNILCNEVHKVSDQCDVWALFIKPKYIEPTNPSKKCPEQSTKYLFRHGEVLESVQRKRESLVMERDRLMNEPDCGEEFIRIKNALRYSAEKAAYNIPRDT